MPTRTHPHGHAECHTRTHPLGADMPTRTHPLGAECQRAHTRMGAECQRAHLPAGLQVMPTHTPAGLQTCQRNYYFAVPQNANCAHPLGADYVYNILHISSRWAQNANVIYFISLWRRMPTHSSPIACCLHNTAIRYTPAGLHECPTHIHPLGADMPTHTFTLGADMPTHTHAGAFRNANVLHTLGLQNANAHTRWAQNANAHTRWAQNANAHFSSGHAEFALRTHIF